MNTTPSQPILIYDGDCGFCKRWIERWKKITGLTVEYKPSDEKLNAVKLIDSDGKVYWAAAAAFKSLAWNPRYAWLYQMYRIFPPFRWLSELGYLWVARNRKLLSRLFR